MDWGLIIQLAVLAAQAFLLVLGASFARQAASFDRNHDFDALADAVVRLQNAARSVRMKQVRGAALEPVQPVQLDPAHMTKDQLRALAAGRPIGVTR